MALDQTISNINNVLNEIHELDPQKIVEDLNSVITVLRKDTSEMQALEVTLQNEVKTRADNEEALALLDRTQSAISEANAELQKYQSLLQYLSTFRSKINEDVQNSVVTKVANDPSSMTLLNY